MPSSIRDLGNLNNGWSSLRIASFNIHNVHAYLISTKPTYLLSCGLISCMLCSVNMIFGSAFHVDSTMSWMLASHYNHGWIRTEMHSDKCAWIFNEICLGCLFYALWYSQFPVVVKQQCRCCTSLGNLNWPRQNLSACFTFSCSSPCINLKSSSRFTIFLCHDFGVLFDGSAVCTVLSSFFSRAPSPSRVFSCLYTRHL